VSRRQPVPKRLGRPQNVDSADTRDRLLDVARQAFASNGFDVTTNKQIAEAAGITAGAIYHYFPSKVDLYLAVYEQVQQVMQRAFDEAINGADTLLERYSLALDAAVALNHLDPSIAGFVVRMSGEAQRHPDLMALLAAVARPGEDFASRLVADARASGELFPDLHARAVEDLLHSVLLGLAQFGTLVDDADRHAAAVDALKRFFAGTFVRRRDAGVTP
jgi:AcrR family transcriptional regulator